jgi:hypothetical protein
MNKPQLRTFHLILNLLGFLVAIIVNALAIILPLNGKTTEELSNQYPNLFVPAGFTFLIWGVIYLLLAAFMIYQFVYSAGKSTPDKSFIEKIGIWFFVSCLGNIGWIFAWHYQIIPLSSIFMVLLLGSLIAIYLKLGIGISDAPVSEKYLVHLPFSVYLGWISIATLANITVFLVSIDWNRFGLSDQFWTIAVIAVGISLSIDTLFYKKDIFYALVVDWALLGILVKRLTTHAPATQGIIITVIIGMCLITIGVITQIMRKRVYH